MIVILVLPKLQSIIQQINHPVMHHSGQWLYQDQEEASASQAPTFCSFGRPFSIQQICGLNCRMALRSNTSTCEEPPNSNRPISCPFCTSAPSSTMERQLMTCPMPTSITATLPRAGCCVLMMKIWRVESEASMACQLTALSKQLDASSCTYDPDSLYDFSMMPATGACHLWQHQGLRKPWQTVPPTKDSSTIRLMSSPFLPIPNMSQSEQLSSFSQKLLLFWALWTGCLGASRVQWSELLVMRRGWGSMGRAPGAKRRMNQLFQQSKPQKGWAGSWTKSLYSTNCRASGDSQPSSWLSTTCDAGDCSIRAQASNILLKWWLTCGKLRKRCPYGLSKKPRKSTEKGMPVNSQF